MGALGNNLEFNLKKKTEIMLSILLPGRIMRNNYDHQMHKRSALLLLLAAGGLNSHNISSFSGDAMQCNERNILNPIRSRMKNAAHYVSTSRI